MNHPAELAILAFLDKAAKGTAKVDKSIVDKVAEDVKDAMSRQFSGGTSRKDFRLRMSNIGRKKCQLWFDKNSPEHKEPMSPYFLINMMLGDIVEAVFKGIMRAANVKFTDSGQVTLKTKHADIKGVGGWWVINKNTGGFKYVEAEGLNLDKELIKIEDTVSYLENDEPFERCFDDIPETYYGKPSGNRKLGVECGFCPYKEKCWGEIQALPSKVSKSKFPPTVYYTHVANA